MGYGQDNDTAMIRELGVVEVKKSLYVHAFEKTDDTCLFTLRKFNKKGQFVYEKTDMTCMGWPTFEEMMFEYASERVSAIAVNRDGKKFNKAYYTYADSTSNAAEVKTVFYQSNDSLLVKNKYFVGEKDRLDSTFTISVLQDGSVKNTKSIGRYNSQGDIVRLYVLEQDNTPVEMIEYEMSATKQLLSVAYTVYGDKPNFTQVFYTYNQNGRIASSYNTINQKQEFLYSDNGLISNILTYNPEGKLEAEYIFSYKYHK